MRGWKKVPPRAGRSPGGWARLTLTTTGAGEIGTTDNFDRILLNEPGRISLNMGEGKSGRWSSRGTSSGRLQPQRTSAQLELGDSNSNWANLGDPNLGESWCIGRGRTARGEIALSST